ncbi:hypothetical protein PFMALIP_05453 [Plasmodium falciparum MaliPS096_E11]|uniref:Uncharacterized protein n=1 Tax=Plasmodium falciparum MaliPS096_E11 TaxID=1036727 RepID=A0A024WIN3_PLAFA|nr:hypothetical protein PFMALIP_05453 [Plasmodium falciparum MaliPS096_E11]
MKNNGSYSIKCGKNFQKNKMNYIHLDKIKMDKKTKCKPMDKMNSYFNRQAKNKLKGKVCYYTNKSFLFLVRNIYRIRKMWIREKMKKRNEKLLFYKKKTNKCKNNKKPKIKNKQKQKKNNPKKKICKKSKNNKNISKIYKKATSLKKKILTQDKPVQVQQIINDYENDGLQNSEMSNVKQRHNYINDDIAYNQNSIRNDNTIDENNNTKYINNVELNTQAENNSLYPITTQKMDDNKIYKENEKETNGYVQQEQYKVMNNYENVSKNNQVELKQSSNENMINENNLYRINNNNSENIYQNYSNISYHNNNHNNNNNNNNNRIEINFDRQLDVESTNKNVSFSSFEIYDSYKNKELQNVPCIDTNQNFVLNDEDDAEDDVDDDDEDERGNNPHVDMKRNYMVKEYNNIHLYENNNYIANYNGGNDNSGNYNNEKNYHVYNYNMNDYSQQNNNIENNNVNNYTEQNYNMHNNNMNNDNMENYNMNSCSMNNYNVSNNNMYNYNVYNYDGGNYNMKNFNKEDNNMNNYNVENVSCGVIISEDELNKNMIDMNNYNFYYSCGKNEIRNMNTKEVTIIKQEIMTDNNYNVKDINDRNMNRIIINNNVPNQKEIATNVHNNIYPNSRVHLHNPVRQVYLESNQLNIGNFTNARNNSYEEGVEFLVNLQNDLKKKLDLECINNNEKFDDNNDVEGEDVEDDDVEDDETEDDDVEDDDTEDDDMII